MKSERAAAHLGGFNPDRLWRTVLLGFLAVVALMS